VIRNMDGLLDDMAGTVWNLTFQRIRVLFFLFDGNRASVGRLRTLCFQK